MKDSEFNKLLEFSVTGGGMLPANQAAVDLIDNCAHGEVISLMEVTARDITYHRAYFSLLGYIYDWLPTRFKQTISRDRFYVFLKYIKGEYDVIYTFADGLQFIELRSISFGKMSQKTFAEYVRNQLPVIYSEVIGRLYQKQDADRIIASIEDEYKIFLSRI